MIKGDKYDLAAERILKDILRIRGENVRERQHVVLAAYLEQFAREEVRIALAVVEDEERGRLTPG